MKESLGKRMRYPQSAEGVLSLLNSEEYIDLWDVECRGSKFDCVFWHQDLLLPVVILETEIVSVSLDPSPASGITQSSAVATHRSNPSPDGSFLA